MRDKLRRLELLREQFERLRFAVETLSFAYVVPGDPGRAPGRRKADAPGAAAEPRVYLVRRGRVRGDFALPRDARTAGQLAEAAQSVFHPAEAGGSAVPTHEVDELLLLSWWFRHREVELGRTVAPDDVLAGAGRARWWRERHDAAALAAAPARRPGRGAAAAHDVESDPDADAEHGASD
jgi:hypothetical protein